MVNKSIAAKVEVGFTFTARHWDFGFGASVNGVVEVRVDLGPLQLFVTVSKAAE